MPPRKPPQTILSPQQCRAARAGLNLSADDLASDANVSRNTISRFEVGASELIAATATALRQALERRGAEFPDLESVRFTRKV
jgi:DNA-binding transcriptional regulator YiaG